MWLCKIRVLGVTVIDNYDSFTYNLVDLLRTLKVDHTIMFNDRIDWQRIDNTQKILISPGPGTPEESGQLLDLIRKYHTSCSILGICLGHQALAQELGGRLMNLAGPHHGQTVSIDLSTEDPLFSGLPEQINGGLYHSWTVDPDSLPKEFEIIARSGQRIMGIRHTQHDLVGLQFHPESYATPFGIEILRNWLAGVSSQVRQR